MYDSYSSRTVGRVIETNTVLRNTFLLLALTLLPTIGGAWFGMVSGLNAWVAVHYIIGFIGFLAVLFALIFAVSATAESGIGVGILLLFTFVFGAMMSGAIEATLALKHGYMIVAQAAGGTALICFICGLYAMVTKRDFSSWGGALFGILCVLIIMMFLNLWLQLPALQLALSIVAVILFSVYLIYDVQQVVNGGETNYVRATLGIYLDIMNIFINLLSILSDLDD